MKDIDNEVEREERQPQSGDETPQRAVTFPKWYDLLAILGLFLVTQLLTQIVFLALGITHYSTADLAEQTTTAARRAMEFEMGRNTLYWSLISQPLVLLLVIAYRKLRGGERVGIEHSMRGFNPSLILWGFIMMLSVVVVIEPLMQMLPEPPIPNGRGIYMLVALIGVAPIFEELLCRGVILELVRRRRGAWVACIVSALIFSAMHIEPQSVLNAFVLGMLLGYIYLRTRSIFAPIILHMLNNALAYMLLIFGLSDNTLSELIRNDNIYNVVYGVSLGIMLLSILSIFRFTRRLDREAERVNGDMNNKNGDQTLEIE